MTGLFDGASIDLDRVQVALDGSRWLWTCDFTTDDVPLMRQLDTAGALVLPLDYIVRWRGALTPDPQPVTAAQCRQVLIGEAA